LRRRLVHLGDASHRVLLQRVVPDGQAEREAEDGGRPLSSAVALRGGELLDELVDLAHGYLAQRVVLEGGHDEQAHVALIEGAGARCEPAREVEVGEPHLDEPTEGAVGRQVATSDGVAVAARELLFQGTLRGLAGVPDGLDKTELTVVVTEPHPRLDLAVGCGDVGELTEGADGGAWPSDLRSPPVRFPAGP
jgi:hypothetical protein